MLRRHANDGRLRSAGCGAKEHKLNAGEIAGRRSEHARRDRLSEVHRIGSPLELLLLHHAVGGVTNPPYAAAWVRFPKSSDFPPLSSASQGSPEHK